MTSGPDSSRVLAQDKGNEMSEDGKRVVEVVSSSYQLSHAELEADARVDATFEEAIAALCQPVDSRYVSRPRADT